MISFIFTLVAETMEECKQEGKYGTAFLAFGLGIAAAIGLLFFYLWLWNVLAAGLIGLPVLNFWQFIGLRILWGFFTSKADNRGNNNIILMQRGDDE